MNISEPETPNVNPLRELEGQPQMGSAGPIRKIVENNYPRPLQPLHFPTGGGRRIAHVPVTAIGRPKGSSSQAGAGCRGVGGVDSIFLFFSHVQLLSKNVAARRAQGLAAPRLAEVVSEGDGALTLIASRGYLGNNRFARRGSLDK